MLLTTPLRYPPIDRLFSDDETIRRWVEVESTLAQVQGKLGMIPADASNAISRALPTFQPDVEALKGAMAHSGVPIAALVQQLRTHVDSYQHAVSAGEFVHFGATTQDILDTVLVLQLRESVTLLRPLLDQTIAELAIQCDRHRYTVIAGRTHAQQALPITFGLKVANWIAPLLRQRERLSQLLPRLFIVQFGGAAGTLAALGDKGLAVQQELATALDLGVPPVSWHNQRDTLVELAGWLVLTSGALAKIAGDVILLSQNEVGELRESADPSRGGSSTMAQKQNPMVSEEIVAVHRLNVGHLSTLQNGMVHHHERGTDSWQAEWQTLPMMLSMTAVALAKGAWLAENIAVDREKMAANVAVSNGVMLAEAAVFALAKTRPRTEAKTVVRAAVEVVLAENRHLIDVLSEMVNAPIDWAHLRDEQNYLGSTNEIINRLLQQLRP